jgi:nitroreductase
MGGVEGKGKKMEHKWLGIGLLAMGVAGLFSIVGVPPAGRNAPGAGCGVAGAVRELPKAGSEGGLGVYDALGMRRAARNFVAGGKLSDEVLGRILWAASGVNRKDGRLTIPTALDSRDLRVFVLDREGVWLYLPEENALRLRKAGDWRAASGKQGFAGKAAVNLVYAVDTAIQAGKGVPGEAIVRNGAFEAGCAAQGVALACAAEGLKNVVRGSWPAEELAEALELPEGWCIVMAQSVGK